MKLEKIMQRSELGFGLILVTALGTCVFSLALAIGLYNPVIFKAYFSHPLVIALNYIPVLLLELAVFCICARIWIAFGISSLFVFFASLAHYYKMKFRSEPFVFSDLSFAKTALGVSSHYDLTPNSRILAFGAYILIVTTVLLILSGKLYRPKISAKLLTVLTVIGLGAALWCKVYTNDSLYNDETTVDDRGTIEIVNYKTMMFVQRGFVYPFIHSIKNGLELAPSGYDQRAMKELYSSYADYDIPEDKRVNIIFFQLESFMDLSTFSIDGISEEAYTIYHQIRDESLHGDLIVSTVAGGTITTEHSVLTGNSCYSDVWMNQPSFVRYLTDKGYYTTGNHPMTKMYYNRDVVNNCLGFETYDLAERAGDGQYYFEGINLNELQPSNFYSDCVLFPTVLQQYKNYLSENRDNSFFSFNVTMQGHPSYDESGLLFAPLYSGNLLSGPAYYAINNYLGSVYDTQKQMMAFIDGVRNFSPTIVVFYGDHCSQFAGPSYNEYDNLFGTYRKMHTTEYLIWANDAAKEVTNNSFLGEGQSISSNYLFSFLFQQLGWEGSGYSVYLREMMDNISVITTDGYYVENGEETLSLTEDGQKKIAEYLCLQYYLHHFPSNEQQF